MRLGVCYYPEHWPPEWWAEDARQMVALGVTQVRIGEFAWSRLEPRPGEFDWAWLDRAVDVLFKAGLKIVLCTPTATPPKWLVDLDPDMLAVGADGQTRQFGSRRHYDFSSDRYLAQSQRITRAMAERYGHHPGVVAWQTDNEYGCHDTVVSYSPQAVQRFRLWLANRYSSVDALNQAWGTVFWSQEYTGFDQIDAPRGTVTEANPAHGLDYRRFASDEVARFNRAQCSILRALSPGRVLVHNFMQLFTGFDHRDVASDLDVASWDSYPLGALEMFWFSEDDKARWRLTGHPDFAGFHHDLYRGMSHHPFWVMEQQPGAVNWATWNPAPALGMVRLWTWEALAHGADVVSYFRWRQAPFGQEQMHEGLQTPSRQFTPGGLQAQCVAQELPLIPVQVTNQAQIAMVLDYSSLWALQVQPQGADYNGLQLAFECYSALRSLGFDIDIVGPDAPLQGYALIALPAQPLVSDRLHASLKATSAQVVLYPRAGAKTADLQIPANLPPGALQDLVGVRVTGVESLRPGTTYALQFKGQSGCATRWRETVQLGPNACAEAQFADGQSAVIRQGNARYLVAWFDFGLQRAILQQAALDAGLAPIALPDGLRIRRRGNILFAFNYNDTPHRLKVPNARWRVGTGLIPAYGISIAERVQE